MQTLLHFCALMNTFFSMYYYKAITHRSVINLKYFRAFQIILKLCYETLLELSANKQTNKQKRKLEKMPFSTTSKLWWCIHSCKDYWLAVKIFSENFISVQLTKFPLINMQLKSEQIVNVITL